MLTTFAILAVVHALAN